MYDWVIQKNKMGRTLSTHKRGPKQRDDEVLSMTGTAANLPSGEMSILQNVFSLTFSKIIAVILRCISKPAIRLVMSLRQIACPQERMLPPLDGVS